MSTRIALVAAWDEVARAAATSALLVDLPDALVIQHDLSPGGDLSRRCWDAGGLIDQSWIRLEHGCISCATREDLVPTLTSVLRERAWTHVVVSLPLTAAPEAITWPLWEAIKHHELDARLAAVLTIADETRLVEDVFGDDLLADRGRVERAFRDILLTDHEAADLSHWDCDDGLDRWLG
ncbi:GTP-binding protein [Arachnia rubra]|uniref:CobW/HypB/UreG nucleotide-binding domain-containing protein n=1 Tax=Arachnia rubra TaxID=1547448 RepID=A0ABX7Y6Q0_9ACTN|nr:GTP-binding protein [Arachnia rubra]MBB1570157.1 hypothetical protein [Propionibacterium sp.]MDO4645526.1 GTP-binding protein [Propionibacteriaceae bacterium]MBB1577542.1 hypothetical protein [Propionibacterium sp.]QUC08904.1 hypothetical protein J5A65_04000 [Arachnia rubra]BCR80342.1 hypothetical protein SK1NUM_07850 [Arachnia rubra]